MTYNLNARWSCSGSAWRADATFREGQEDAIRHIVEGRGRLLVVQKTGWGRASSTSSRRSCCATAATARRC
jgi:hypothetical protein